MNQHGNLDTESAKDVIEILRKVAKDKLVIIVTHNLEQIEEYATRIIKMYDGRVVEDKEIKQVDKSINAMPSEFKKITLLNKYRLGARNTFNILSKFLLLFFVFFFITSAVYTEYASFKLYEDISKDTVNSAIGFNDLSEERIIVNKQDRTYFTDADYEKINEISNIEKIIKDDVFIDTTFSLESMQNSMFVSGEIRDIKNFEGRLDIGRMPENDNEVVIISNRKSFYITDRLDELLRTKFNLRELGDKQFTIVGIKLKEKNDNDYYYPIYVSENVISTLRATANKQMSNVKILFNNKYEQANVTSGYSSMYNILPSKNVEKGQAIVFDNMKYQLSKGSIKNKDLNIYVNNIYYNDELNLKISNTYTKSNFKRMTGYDDYDNNQTSIFINEEEYNSLYDKPSYQSSVYVKDVDDIENTMNELKSLGLEPKKVTDFVVNNWELQQQFIKIAKVIVTIIVVFVLFFISYFIIRIILKSRNIYYTTLRILGATSKSIKKILDIELFINASLAYSGVLIFLYFVKNEIINFEYIARLTDYVGFFEYATLYLTLIIMSKLISRRFSKKLFKKTVITTYNEEV